MEPKEYYNNFSNRLISDYFFGNARHNHINKSLEQLVKPGMSVLDLGCGAGISSLFMHKLGANVTAVDFSTIAIEFARKHLPGPEYIEMDMINFRSGKTYDFIAAIDCLEHIENTEDGIATIAEHANKETLIYINIPDVRYQRFIRENHPDKLQIIDNGISLKTLTTLMGKHNLKMITFNIYGISVPVQYNEFTFQMRIP